MLDLNSLVSGSGWTITDAQGINDSGWIAATGFNPVLNGGNPEALLLTPIEVPEPSTVGILGLGVVVLLVRRKSPQRCQSGGRRIAGEPS
jgi:hypothetical protein